MAEDAMNSVEPIKPIGSTTTDSATPAPPSLSEPDQVRDVPAFQGPELPKPPSVKTPSVKPPSVKPPKLQTPTFGNLPDWDEYMAGKDPAQSEPNPADVFKLDDDPLTGLRPAPSTTSPRKFPWELPDPGMEIRIVPRMKDIDPGKEIRRVPRQENLDPDAWRSLLPGIDELDPEIWQRPSPGKEDPFDKLPYQILPTDPPKSGPGSKKVPDHRYPWHDPYFWQRPNLLHAVRRMRYWPLCSASWKLTPLMPMWLAESTIQFDSVLQKTTIVKYVKRPS